MPQRVGYRPAGSAAKHWWLLEWPGSRSKARLDGRSFLRDRVISPGFFSEIMTGIFDQIGERLWIRWSQHVKMVEKDLSREKRRKSCRALAMTRNMDEKR